jgi:hypothetical protein
VAVEVKLQPKRTPGGHAQITQPEFFVDEVEVIMQALAAVGFEKRTVRLLVVPGLVRAATLHGREHVHQTGMVSPFGEDFLDAVFLAEGLQLANELDFHPGFACNPFGVLANVILERFGEVEVIEDANLACAEKLCHAARVARCWQRPLNHDPIQALQRTGNLPRTTLHQSAHRGSPLSI